MPEMQNPVRRKNRWNENAEKLAESHAHRGDRPSLNDQEQRPPIQESPERAERFTQINVLASGSRHHRRQLAVTQSPDNSHESRYEPGGNQQRGRIHFS